jgi:hypothetical protein
MMIEKECVTVKKHKDDFMPLNASIVGMDPRVLAAHNFHKDMILDEIVTKMAMTSAGASATASASASTPAPEAAAPLAARTRHYQPVPLRRHRPVPQR